VTAPGRLWMARGFALLLGRLTALAGYTICPNLIISENSLKWPEQNLYSAREICQMIPIAGMPVYDRFRQANEWTAEFLPNAAGAPASFCMSSELPRSVQRISEGPLRGPLGSRIESWEMKRKVRRLTQQRGFGIETRFDAEVCQGNFLHHSEQTRRALEERLARLRGDLPFVPSTDESD
jgi:hypothetical protein